MMLFCVNWSITIKTNGGTRSLVGDIFYASTIKSSLGRWIFGVWQPCCLRFPHPSSERLSEGAATFWRSFQHVHFLGSRWVPGTHVGEPDGEWESWSQPGPGPNQLLWGTEKSSRRWELCFSNKYKSFKSSWKIEIKMISWYKVLKFMSSFYHNTTFCELWETQREFAVNDSFPKAQPGARQISVLVSHVRGKAQSLEPHWLPAGVRMSKDGIGSAYGTSTQSLWYKGILTGISSTSLNVHSCNGYFTSPLHPMISFLH